MLSPLSRSETSVRLVFELIKITKDWGRRDNSDEGVRMKPVSVKLGSTVYIKTTLEGLNHITNRLIFTTDKQSIP